MDRKRQKLAPEKIMNNRYPQTPGMNPPPGIPRDYPYGPNPMPTSNPLYTSGVGFAPNMSASPYPSVGFTSRNPSNSSYPAASSSYLLVPNNPYLVFSSQYPASYNNPYPASTSHYPASSNSAYPASASAFPTSTNSCYPTSCNCPHPAPTSAYPSSCNIHYPAPTSSYFATSYPAPTSSYLATSYPAPTSSYLATSYPAPASMNQSPGASPNPSMGYRIYDSKFRPNIMNNRYPQTPGLNPPTVIPRDYPCGPTPMLTFNPLYPSVVGFAPNISASHPSTVFTPGNPSTSSYPAASSSYLLVPNNPYLLFSSSYPASFNNPYPASTSRYAASSNSPYPASASAFSNSSNSCYPTNCNSPHPGLTTSYPSNRHYSASTSLYLDTSYPAPASPYPSMASRAYDNRFGPSVYETNDDALNINDLPNEIILGVFAYLTQNQLCQIARVCRRWNALTRSPVLWKRVNVKFSPSNRCRTTVPESFINGLPSCVTSIRLRCTQYRDRRWTRALYFEELCAKLQQKCPHLEELVLIDFKLLDSLPAAIDLCTEFLLNLKNLVFRNCIFLECRARTEFGGILKIEVLDLSRCKFRYNKLQFSRMPCLKVLRLYRTDAWDSWLEDDTSFLNQLHVLDVGFTDITTRIAAIIFQAIQYHGLNLKELYLCCAYLQNHDITFNNLTFPHLKTICVADTWVTWEGVFSLIQSCSSVENVYVGKDVAESFAAHPFVVANKCKSGIVKAINSHHKHIVDYLHN